MWYLELVMFAVGVVTMIFGRIALVKNHEIEGVMARLIGLVLCLPVPVAFCLILLVLKTSAPGTSKLDILGTIEAIELMCILSSAAGALVLAAASGTDEEERRENAEQMWLEDPDGARILYPEFRPSKARMKELLNPKRRPRKLKKKSGMSQVVVVSLVVAGLLLAVGFYFALAALDRDKKPAPAPVAPAAPPTESEAREQAAARKKGEEVARLAEEEAERAGAEGHLARADADEKAGRKEAARLAEREREEGERLSRGAAEREERERKAREQADATAKLMAALEASRLQGGVRVLNVPEPRAGANLPLGVRQRGEGLTWAELALDPASPAPPAPKPKTPAPPPPKPKVPAAGAAPEPPKPGTPVAGMTWAPDGKSFVVATTSGLVRRVGASDLKELRRLELGHAVTGVAACAPGVLLTLGELGELWLLDPDTLAVAKRFGTQGPCRALTGPALDVAYVVKATTAAQLPTRLDLTTGVFSALVPGERRPDAGAPPAGGGTLDPALSPDGRFLFYDEGDLARYRLDGDKVHFDGAPKERAGGGVRRGVFVSPDGQSVCLPTGGGNDGTGGYGTWVYKADDFDAPPVLVKPGVVPGVVGFDPSGKRIFAQNTLTPLLVFDAAGATKGAHKLGRTPGSAVRGFAGHPADGRSLLVRTADQVIVVQFAKVAE